MPGSGTDTPYTLSGSGKLASRNGLRGASNGAAGVEKVVGGPLLYSEGGTVQQTPTVHLILWGANFNPGGNGENEKKGAELKTMLEEQFKELSNSTSAYQGILTQYFDSASRVAPAINFPEPAYVYTQTEGEAAPSSLNEKKVEEAISGAIALKKWAVDINTQFVLVTAPGSTYQQGFMAGLCAYHGLSETGVNNSGRFVYGFDPYQGDSTPYNNGCLTEDEQRNPVHMTSKVASHEYSEAATDPRVGCGEGWRTLACGAEIGDLCNANLDKKLPGTEAWVQPEYDDHLGGCVYEDLNPPHVLGLTSQATNVGEHSATLNATVNDEGEPGEATYYFEYATNPSFTGATRVPKEGTISAGTGFQNHEVHQTLTGLQLNTIYHYRVVAQNGGGVTEGEDQEFRPSEWPRAGLAKPPANSQAALSGVSCVSSKSCVAVGTEYSPATPYAETWNGNNWSAQAFPVPERATALKQPEGVAVDAKGDVWVVDAGNYRVEEFSAEGTFMKAFGWGVQNEKPGLQTCISSCKAGVPGSGPGQIGEASAFGQAVGIAVAPNGNLWVADHGNTRVMEFKPEASVVKYETEIGPNGPDHFALKDPLGVAVDPNPSRENVWVADHATGQLDEFSSSGTAIRQVSSSDPDGVAVDSSGHVWTSEVNLNRVSEFSATTGGLEKTVGWGVGGGTGFEICAPPVSCQSGLAGSGEGQFYNPTGVGVDSAGNAWIVDRWDDRVQEISAAGKYVTQFGSFGGGIGQLSAPWGVVLASGSLYVADTSNGRVQRWTLGAEGSPPTYASKMGAAGGSAQASGVSCTSPTACTAVGQFENGKGLIEPLAERWNGSEWTSEVVPPPTGVKAAVLLGVSCSTSSECMAVGYGETSEGLRPYTAQRTSTGWTNVSIEAPSTPITQLRSVSCTSANACVAVGQTEVIPPGQWALRSTFAASWNGTQWTKLPTLSPSGSPRTNFVGVSCTSATSCEVVGNDETLQSYAANWNGKEWVLQSIARPQVFRYGLLGVSCSATNACTTVGAYEIKSNVWVPLVESWNGETWRVRPTNDEVDNEDNAGIGELNAVSCVNSPCVAVGRDVLNTFDKQLGLASLTPSYVSSIGSSGSGAGQVKQPEGVAVDSKGNLWMVDAANYRVDEFSTEGTFIKAFGWGVLHGGNHLETCPAGSTCKSGLAGSGAGQIGQEGGYKQAVGIAIAPNGNLWVADPGNKRVSEFKPEATSVKFETEIGANGPDHFSLSDPLGVAVDATSGNLWVADWATGQLDEFSSSGTAIRQVASVDADGVAIDSGGNVWTSEVNLNRVSEFSSTGVLKETIGWGVNGGEGLQTCTASCKAGVAGSGEGQFNNPAGISVDSGGKIWVVDHANHRVQELSSGGEFITQFGSSGTGNGQFWYPWGVALSGGSAYVTDTGNSRVEKWAVSE
jgi:sugar lactone lactonase YvrE